MRFFLIVFILLSTLFSPSFAAYPQRIVSGIPSVTEMLFAIGASNEVVGVTTNCDYPLEAKQKDKIGGYFLNLEKIVALNPDLVILLEDAQKEDIKRFKDFGLNVHTINPRSVSEVMDAILGLGTITGRTAEAEVVVTDMQNRLAEVKVEIEKAKRKAPKILVVVGYNPLIVAGKGTFIDDIVKLVAGENMVGFSRVAYPQYSLEKLTSENPEYIVMPKWLVKEEELKNDSIWQNLSALKNNKLLLVDGNLLNRPGPRVVDAVEQIADFIYENKTQ